MENLTEIRPFAQVSLVLNIFSRSIFHSSPRIKFYPKTTYSCNFPFFHRIMDRSKRFKSSKEEKVLRTIKKKKERKKEDPLRENPRDWAGVLLNRG